MTGIRNVLHAIAKCVKGALNKRYYLLSDINECESNPCENGGVCEDVVDGYLCTCASGYTDTECQIGKGR